MTFWSGDTALEVGSALARADLSDRTSFASTVDVVKRYVSAKMKKSKGGHAVAMPGGKLEVLETKYAHLGYQDIFYLARFELRLPPSSIHLPRPSSPVRRKLVAAGYPLPEEYKTDGEPSTETSDPSVTPFPPTPPTTTYPLEKHKQPYEPTTTSSHTTSSITSTPASSPASPQKIEHHSSIRKPPLRSAGSESSVTSNVVPVVRPSSRDWRLSPEWVATDQVQPLPPFPPLDLSPPVPRAPVRAATTPANVLLPRSSSRIGHSPPAPICQPSLAPAAVPEGGSPTLPSTPEFMEFPLPPGTPKMNGKKRAKLPPTPTASQKQDKHSSTDIRALFDSLPPEAQAMAVQRLEARRREVEQQERRRIVGEDEVESRARDEARRRRHDSRGKSFDLDRKQVEIQTQREQLLATQQLDHIPSPVLRDMNNPDPSQAVDEDARRMIEARIATLQTALASMGVDASSSALASPMTTRSPASSRAITLSTSPTISPLSSPAPHTPRSPFVAPLPMQAIGSRSRVLSHEDRANVYSDAFELDDHLDALRRISEESQYSGYSRLPQMSAAGTSRRSKNVAPLTPSALASAIGSRQRVAATRKETSESENDSPPPSYTVVDLGALGL